MAAEKLPIKMLNDRLLVRLSKEDGERTSSGGILIPATAQMAKWLVWGEVVALGPNARSAEVGERRTGGGRSFTPTVACRNARSVRRPPPSFLRAPSFLA